MDPESVASSIDVFPLENGNVNDAARSVSRHASDKGCVTRGRTITTKVGSRIYEGNVLSPLLPLKRRQQEYWLHTLG
jgi:hypothetical protein